MKVSVLYPTPGHAPPGLEDFARAVQQRSFDRLWLGQSAAADPAHTLVRLAGAGLAVPAGIGVTLMPLRHPFDAALQARSLVEATGARLTVGYGPGARSFQTTLLGAPYPSPLTAAEEYVGTVAALVGGQMVDVHGDYVVCRGGLPPLGRDVAVAETGVGVLRAGMAGVAGRLGAAAITWLTPAKYIHDELLPAVAAGAATTGRAPGPVVAMVPVALRRPQQDPVQVVLASNGVHLRREHYIAMLRQAGVAVDAGSSRRTAAALIAGGAFLHGSLDEVVAGLEQYRLAGVDEVVLNPTGTVIVDGHGTALEDCLAVAAAVTERS